MRCKGRDSGVERLLVLRGLCGERLGCCCIVCGLLGGDGCANVSRGVSLDGVRKRIKAGRQCIQGGKVEGHLIKVPCVEGFVEAARNSAKLRTKVKKLVGQAAHSADPCIARSTRRRFALTWLRK